MSDLTEKVTTAIAQAAYPEVHPDFTDAGWDKMGRAAIEAMREPLAKSLCVQCADGRPLDNEGNHVSKLGGGGILLPNGRCNSWKLLKLIDAALRK